MTDDYREYLELYEYFGRAGLEKLSFEEFTELSIEFAAIVAVGAPWTAEQRDRLKQLQQMLFRDRPLLK